MKKLAFVLLILCASQISAQNINPLTKAFSAGLELGIPSTSIYNIGLGASGKFEFPVSDKLCLTVTGGYDAFFYKSNLFESSRTPTAALYIPLKAGGKYYFNQQTYLEGELGAVIETNYLTQDLFAFSIGPGFVIPTTDNRGIDFGFRYEQWSNHQVRQTAIRVAYRLGW